MQVRFSPGRPLKLAASQRKRLVRLLLKGPMAQGYRTKLWTTARLAKLVESKFGVRYHPDHIGRLMHSVGWTPQKPEKSALERDEDQIERWSTGEDHPLTNIGQATLLVDEFERGQVPAVTGYKERVARTVLVESCLLVPAGPRASVRLFLNRRFGALVPGLHPANFRGDARQRLSCAIAFSLYRSYMVCPPDK